MVHSTVLGCNHAFCRTCLLEYTVKRGYARCPLCRDMIDEDIMASILESRPFTRNRAQRVRTDLAVWKCRIIIRMLKKPQSFVMILMMATALRLTLNENPEARRILAPEIIVFTF